MLTASISVCVAMALLSFVMLRRHQGKCSWYSRWMHRRQRRIDLQFMLPALRLKAGSERVAQAAFDIFKKQTGQEHWRCECAKHEAELEAQQSGVR